MPTPLTDTERARIVELAHQGLSVRAIGKQVGRAHGTVSDVLKAAGVKRDQSQTIAATEARKVDNAAKRAALESALLDDVDRLRRQLFAPAVERKAMVVSDGENMGSHVEIVDINLDEPTFGDKRNLMVSIGIGIQRSIDLHRVDADTGSTSAVEEWLATMLGRAVGGAMPAT